MIGNHINERHSDECEDSGFGEKPLFSGRVFDQALSPDPNGAPKDSVSCDCGDKDIYNIKHFCNILAPKRLTRV